MFRTIPPSLIRSFSLYTQQWYMSYRLVDSFRGCSKAVYKPLWHIPLLCIQWKTPDDGQKNCPKHVEFQTSYFIQLNAQLGCPLKLYMFRGNSSVHHQEFFTVDTATVYVIQVCWQLSSLLASCLQTCMTYTIAICTVKNSWWWTEELLETCRISMHKLVVHSVG